MTFIRSMILLLKSMSADELLFWTIFCGFCTFAGIGIDRIVFG